ncbi:MAG TPA: helix-turn-helix domain-containing protein, partial [Allosphingosinicella sp.]|nr:helix-turn-helix domain-containing protein [Allosphingosinicella sp.]
MSTATAAARPTARGKETRARILDMAEEAILAKGFDATSIEEIVAAAEITRSGFFYHFRDKNELA